MVRSASALAGGALVALAISSTGAQELELAALQEVDDDRTDITHDGLTVDELEELDIVRDGETIGDVEAVLAMGSEIVALVVDHDRDLARIGDGDVVVPIDEFELIEGRRAAELALTDEELAELEVWEDD